MISFFNSDNDNISPTSATKQELEIICKMLKECDAVLVGAGSGLSSAAGYNHYHYCDAFKENFGDYIKAYGFKGMFDGYYHLFSSPSEQWAYYSRYIDFMLNAPVAQVYHNLSALIKDKDYFVLTSNCDTQVARAFDSDRIFEYQGSFSYLQCSQPCCDKIYSSEPYIKKMLLEFDDFKVPQELIPRCDKCGRIMTPWVRDNEFLEGEYWKKQQKRYCDFVEKNKGKKLLLLELGVGDMTPSVIKFPFWRLCEQVDGAFYVSVNLAKSNPPAHLKNKAIAVADDLNSFLKQLLTEVKANG